VIIRTVADVLVLLDSFHSCVELYMLTHLWQFLIYHNLLFVAFIVDCRKHSEWAWSRASSSAECYRQSQKLPSAIFGVDLRTVQHYVKVPPQAKCTKSILFSLFFC